MIVKMMITFEYNPETNEYTPLKQEILKEKKQAVKVSSTMPDDKPLLRLYDNKYELNESALELLDVHYGDRIDIKYPKEGNVLIPIIGSENSWGTKSGNKLTKSNTVSYRGNAHTLLEKYGEEFTLEQYKDKDGLFILKSTTESNVVEDDSNIEIKESEETSVDIEDIKDNTPVEDPGDFDIEDFDIEEDEDKNNFEIKNFNFKL